MSYNVKKITREWNRQRVLQNSWRHIDSELERINHRNEHKSVSQCRSYLIQWCRRELIYLRSVNMGFPTTKAEKAVHLLMRRIQSGNDPVSYNVQQLKIQASRNI